MGDIKQPKKEKEIVRAEKLKMQPDAYTKLNRRTGHRGLKTQLRVHAADLTHWTAGWLSGDSARLVSGT